VRARGDDPWFVGRAHALLRLGCEDPKHASSQEMGPAVVALRSGPLSLNVIHMLDTDAAAGGQLAGSLDALDETKHQRSSVA
jgi:hypothetical protein